VNVISNRTGQNMVKAQVQLLAALVMGVIATATACSSDSTPPSDAAESSTPTNGASSLLIAPEDIEDPSAAAVAAYERYWRTVAEATAIPDPRYPALAEVASGAALTTAQELAQSALDAGERDTGAPTHSAAVTDTYPDDNPTEFVITDCSDSSDWITVDSDTGEPVPGEEYGTRAIQALVEHVEGKWLVTEVAIQGIDSC
jgi:hypothetical protein